MASASASSASRQGASLQSSGMLPREQLVYLFNRFAFLTSSPDVKQRIKEAVRDKQTTIGVLQDGWLWESGSARAWLIWSLKFIQGCGKLRLFSMQEAVAVTTTIQEEILLEMGIDPGFGIACLGKVNTIYEDDRDLMIQFYRFVAKEELACDEAELEPDEFAEKMYMQQKLQEEQLEMLKSIRKYSPGDQTLILEKLHQQMESSNFDNSIAVLTPEQIQETVQTHGPPFKNRAR
ncbi:hypothetical protein Taro_047121 [Colocasia esculenta]|uniref:Uncharacterized protein n=1 Tax=Colocasia esculenta TaxID=4460 RepID=A0A843WUE4_COLES|nr:hypothetical protein [Colocasia esculenta]